MVSPAQRSKIQPATLIHFVRDFHPMFLHLHERLPVVSHVVDERLAIFAADP